MYTNKRTTEVAEGSFNIAFRNIDTKPDRNSKDAQYAMYMALGLRDVAVALREIYDKLEQIDKKLSARA